MSAEEDARARRDAWVAAGAPDYNAPTRDDGGNVTGYQSVADQAPEERSHDNDNLPATMDWLRAGAPDYNAPSTNAAGQITGYTSVTATPVNERSASNQNLEMILRSLMAPTGVGGGTGGTPGAGGGLPLLSPANAAMAARTGSILPASGGDSLSRMMANIQRRASLQGFVPQANRDRTDRALAAIYQNVPAVRELAINSPDMDAQDWRGAVTKWLGGKDALQFAQENGFIAPPSPRTVEEAVDAQTLSILKAQGLFSPELEAKVNTRLQANYDAEARGEPIPEVDPAGVSGSRFLPPIPSAQLWNGLFNQGEREGTGQLFQALGLSPQLLTDQIARLAPPGAMSGLSQMAFRRR